MFSELKIGDNLEKNILNNSLKELYSTNYFKTVSLSISDGVLKINLIENPIIQKISINGINENNIYENIKKITSKLEKYPFIESKIEEQNKLLKNALKSYGYYFVELETLINTNTNNTIDLIYNFSLGEIAKITKIKFIGNTIFRDSTLRNIIISEEAKFWKFITRNKFLNTDRIKLDVSRLIKFYKNRGYYFVDIKSATAIINENNQFELVFNINAGDKYYINEIKISENQNYIF